MRFKQFQHVKEKAYTAFATGTSLDVPGHDAAHADSLNLALVGDAHYALTMRKRLVATGIPSVRVLHTLAAEFVSAKAQSFVYRVIKERFNEVEAEVCQRARNTGSGVPKSASVAEYRDSTALEALVGYLVLAGQKERLCEIMDLIYEGTKTYCELHHKE